MSLYRGAKNTEYQKNFSSLRNAINQEFLLPRHIRLMQPKEHFFVRSEERKISPDHSLKVMKKCCMVYAKRINDEMRDNDKVTPYTFIYGDLIIPVLCESNSTRVQGNLDDGLPTVCICPVTVYTRGDILKNKNLDNPLRI